MQEKEASNLTIGGILQKRERLKQAAFAVIKHLKSNAAVYFHLIGALSNADYPQIIFWLKVLIFRVALGAIQQRLENRERNRNVSIKKKPGTFRTILFRNNDDK